MKAITSGYSFSRYGAQALSRFCSSAAIREQQQQNDHHKKTTLDDDDVKHHSKFHDNWWDVGGQMKGLHAMNLLRIQFIRDGLLNTGHQEINPCQPLNNVKILDIGCGGGILSEPLARIGAQVTGLDASKELIATAKRHAMLDENLASNLNYVHTTIEDFTEENTEQFDAVVASEILEHVIDRDLFLKSCTAVLKPKGSIFITTINKNLMSWFGAIVAAEYLLRIIPLGTHDWNKFISPQETRQLLDKYNCKTKLIHGMIYNPITNQWSWTSSTAISYALHAVKYVPATK